MILPDLLFDRDEQASTSAFAVLTGTPLAGMRLHYGLGFDLAVIHWIWIATAIAVSACSSGLVAMYLLRQSRISPAQSLRSGA
jgi:hypothetical protein